MSGWNERRVSEVHMYGTSYVSLSFPAKPFRRDQGPCMYVKSAGCPSRALGNSLGVLRTYTTDEASVRLFPKATCI